MYHLPEGMEISHTGLSKIVINKTTPDYCDVRIISKMLKFIMDISIDIRAETNPSMFLWFYYIQVLDYLAKFSLPCIRTCLTG